MRGIFWLINKLKQESMSLWYIYTYTIMTVIFVIVNSFRCSGNLVYGAAFAIRVLSDKNERYCKCALDMLMGGVLILFYGLCRKRCF